jgi:hypothetical protein
VRFDLGHTLCVPGTIHHQSPPMNAMRAKHHLIVFNVDHTLLDNDQMVRDLRFGFEPESFGRSCLIGIRHGSIRLAIQFGGSR